ncbi:MAG TPA: tRNA lysidine(34) synthetase TilS [Solirubrobacteraceae bacterium]|nr:tRNA lysidine(34) synthetase TilS [Solirubrobacteraceae bacterium]
MNELIDEVRAEGLLREGRAVVVMYSGGRDSTCLLDVAVRVAGPAAVSALHVNYGLRAGADSDERHCAELCEHLGVQLDVRRPVRPADRAGNLQAWARDQRYRAAADLAVARDADVAAGHTRSDQVETILYRLASSPSRRALLGMRPRDGALIRPLLGFTREQTGEYCRQQGLRWRDDESNDSAAYARNRIRRELVPALERAHPAAQDNLLALAEILRAEAEVLEELVGSVLEGRDGIALAQLRELPSALRRLVVQRLADDAAGGPAAGVARRADEVAAMREGAALDLPSGVRATVEAGVVRVGRTPPLDDSAAVRGASLDAERPGSAARGAQEPVGEPPTRHDQGAQPPPKLDSQ